MILRSLIAFSFLSTSFFLSQPTFAQLTPVPIDPEETNQIMDQLVLLEAAADRALFDLENNYATASDSEKPLLISQALKVILDSSSESRQMAEEHYLKLDEELKVIIEDKRAKGEPIPYNWVYLSRGWNLSSCSSGMHALIYFSRHMEGVPDRNIDGEQLCHRTELFSEYSEFVPQARSSDLDEMFSSIVFYFYERKATLNRITIEASSDRSIGSTFADLNHRSPKKDVTFEWLGGTQSDAHIRYMELNDGTPNNRFGWGVQARWQQWGAGASGPKEFDGRERDIFGTESSEAMIGMGFSSHDTGSRSTLLLGPGLHRRTILNSVKFPNVLSEGGYKVPYRAEGYDTSYGLGASASTIRNGSVLMASGHFGNTEQTLNTEISVPIFWRFRVGVEYLIVRDQDRNLRLVRSGLVYDGAAEPTQAQQQEVLRQVQDVMNENKLTFKIQVGFGN